MNIYVVRHGETDWNKEKRIQGRADIALNDFGKRLAEKTAAGLAGIAFDRCYTSPLLRAKETAEIILRGRSVPTIEDDRIIEMSFGAYEGQSCVRKNDQLPESFWCFFKDPSQYAPPPGGEQFQEVIRRTSSFLEELCSANTMSHTSLLVVTHGAAIAGMLNGIKGEPLHRYWGDGVHSNCGVTTLYADENGIQILSENKVYYDDVVEPWEEDKTIIRNNKGDEDHDK